MAAVGMAVGVATAAATGPSHRCVEALWVRRLSIPSAIVRTRKLIWSFCFSGATPNAVVVSPT